MEGRERGPNIPLINDRSWYGLSFVGSIQTDFSTHTPTHTMRCLIRLPRTLADDQPGIALESLA